MRDCVHVCVCRCPVGNYWRPEGQGCDAPGDFPATPNVEELETISFVPSWDAGRVVRGVQFSSHESGTRETKRFEDHDHFKNLYCKNLRSRGPSIFITGGEVGEKGDRVKIDSVTSLPTWQKPQLSVVVTPRVRL